ncbi:MAG: ribbon-helix-helix protein, CopG family [Candidatus Omnitrophota bacterium]|nr:ribbon-helix-helix protein, CopG family [Candidatus Omnitrophota bacterium]
MKAQHVNITIPIGLKERIDEESKREHIGRSTLIQRAVSFYLDLVNRKKLRALLAEGYSEMAGEAIKITNEFEVLDNETLRYAD